MYDFIVTSEVGGRTVNKLLRVEEKSSLLPKAKEAFSVTEECQLEWYFKPYDVYVSVDSSEEIPDDGKVRLIVDKGHDETGSDATPSTRQDQASVRLVTRSCPCSKLLFFIVTQMDEFVMTRTT